MYLADDYAGPQAGTEGQILHLINHLDRSRFEPTMTVLRSSDYLDRGGWFPCSSRVLHIANVARISTFLKMTRFGLGLRREGFKLVHCFFNDVSIIAPPILKSFGIPTIVSRRDMGFWYTPAKLVALRVASLCVDRYVANCQAVGDMVQRLEWVPSRKVSIIYNGVFPIDDEVCEREVHLPEEILGDGPVVGIVANLKPIKRIDVLIRAMAIVHKQCPHARLVIIGKDGISNSGPSMKQELEELAARLQIREQVIFTGGVENVASLVKRFTVAVLCSQSEGLSNSIIEYMSAGCPVVCTDTGGNRELIQNGLNGFLVPPGDVDMMADRLVALLSDQALARRLGVTARETVRSMCSHTRMIAEQMTCYDEVLSGSRSAPQFKSASGAVR